MLFNYLSDRPDDKAALNLQRVHQWLEQWVAIHPNDEDIKSHGMG